MSASNADGAGGSQTGLVGTAAVPKRLGRPRWLDARVIGGLVLVIVAVVVGARVVGASAHTTGVWAANRDLAAGTVLTATDLREVDVNLADSTGHYLAAGGDGRGVVGASLSVPVRAGELMPASAVRATAPGRVVVVGVAPDRMPPGVAHGSVIDLYLTSGGATSAAPVRTDLVSAGLTVQSVTAPASGGLSGASSSRYQIAVLVAADVADALVKTLPKGDAIVVLVTGSPMSTGVLTAGNGQSWENDLVAALGRPGAPMTVARRCVDIADVLANATTGQASVVVLSADLRRLDSAAVQRLAAAGVAVVGVYPAGEDRVRERLERIGISHLLADDAGASALLSVASEAITQLANGPFKGLSAHRAVSDPRFPLLPGQVRDVELPGPGQPDPAPSGRVIAVWGPAGAPGRTTLAAGLAVEAAAAGLPALLVDADVYGGVLASAFGLLDESPGLAGACRQAANGRLDLASLEQAGVDRRRGSAAAHRHRQGGSLARGPSVRDPGGARRVPLDGPADRRRLRVLPGVRRGDQLRHGGAPTQRRDAGRPRVSRPGAGRGFGRPARDGTAGPGHRRTLRDGSGVPAGGGAEPGSADGGIGG